MADIRDVAGVVQAQARGERIRFLFFWGHRPGASGVGAGCLSQWWDGAPFTVDGTTYATAEHYMMAGKARLFGDAEMERRILEAAHPKQAKDLGGQVRGFDQETWNAHRSEIVVQGNLAKFGQHPELGAYLLGTGERVLVEASPMDRIWGIGLAADDERAGQAARWRGLNLLGFALMDVRARLRG
ncbi:NADAR family protein [Actinomadura macrotermitis]|uniref:NADAR domain-containing protein n=1 Tax=Actinomadura macrotermitis TaxID=2585200 RepID=A0A7K0BZK4_9ACTN|nr:NADAR family protein [Actinomadura macrotermitis]MQY06610.1 hypothetical protein [Actinomadura macrotermitis]